MEICGNNIERVKFVLHNKIMEHVLAFNYLGYLISDHTINAEIKLQQCAKELTTVKEMSAYKCYQRQK
jgi:hypothetical protein